MDTLLKFFVGFLSVSAAQEEHHGHEDDQEPHDKDQQVIIEW